MNRHHAALVSALVTAVIGGDNLADTPLSLLPAFARKLRATVGRKRVSDSSDGSIAVGNLTRGEARSAVLCLALYSHPSGVLDDVLTIDEAHAVREVTLALAAALLARRGPARLDRAAVNRRLEVWNPEKSSYDGDDRARWIHRLKRRVNSEDTLLATPSSPIPKRLARLLSRQKFTGN